MESCEVGERLERSLRVNAIRVLGVLELLGFHLVELRCVQEAMRRAYYERDSERGLYATFAWLVEEVGELAEALLSRDYSRVEEEIADIVAWTLSIANLVGVDVEEALRKKYLSDLETASCD